MQQLQHATKVPTSVAGSTSGMNTCRIPILSALLYQSEPRYFVGVDLGQSRDPTAITVVRRVEPTRPVPEADKPKPSYAPGSVEWEEEQRRLKDKAAVG